VAGVDGAGPVHAASTEIVSTVKPIKVSLLAADPAAPGMPVVLAGRAFRLGESNEAVMDRNLAARSGLQVGDWLRIRSVQGFEDKFYSLRIVGLSEGQSYLFQPSLFVAPTTWETVRPQSEADLADSTSYPNIIVVRLKDPAQASAAQARLPELVPKIEVADIATTINNIPGYSAQQTTVQTQGFFTLLIGVLVIGGFFQIQVLQKVPQIGMLKAIGSSNGAIGGAAVIQIVVVTAIGVFLGSLLAYLFSLGFPPTVPLIFNGISAAISILALMLIGPLGGLVSILYAVRIEPLRALRLQ
jgi:putative ABC transport system permease protein